MDYLEGALLGKLWSDTDFENRRHRGVALLMCVLFWVYGFYLIYQLNFTKMPRVIQVFFVWFLLSAILFLLSPLLCYYYYNVPLPVRCLILLLQAAKYFFSYMFLYALVVPLVRFNKEKLVTDVMNYLNRTVNHFFETGIATQSMAGLILQAVLFSLLALLILVLFFALLAVLPMLYMKLLHFIQYSVDQAFIHLMRAVRGQQGHKGQQAGNGSAAQVKNTGRIKNAGPRVM